MLPCILIGMPPIMLVGMVQVHASRQAPGWSTSIHEQAVFIHFSQ
jgi:hypothetical protein